MKNLLHIEKLEPAEIEAVCSHAWEGNFMDVKTLLRGVFLSDINNVRSSRQVKNFVFL